MIEENGQLKGASAVIDKDYASSLLALTIGVDLFLISTAVEKVALNFGRPNQKWLDRMTLAEARQYLKEGHFAKGSMYPKIKAITEFLEGGGKEALITNPENIERWRAKQGRVSCLSITIAFAGAMHSSASHLPFGCDVRGLAAIAR